MLDLFDIGSMVSKSRKSLGLTQDVLADRASVSRATVVALEAGTATGLGFNKLMRILAVVRLDLRVMEAGSRRPTLEDLLEEQENDTDMDRRP